MIKHPRKWKRIPYDSMNSRQQEIFNFQKISGLLSDFGFSASWVKDDWNHTDFLAVPFDGSEVFRVQLKGRPYFFAHSSKNLWVCYIARKTKNVYFYDHDRLLALAKTRGITKTEEWQTRHSYSYPNTPQWLTKALKPYLLGRLDSI
ncbi:MAG TPA: hypothetical protein VGN88_02600 [Phycisphaerae bacterium]|jgi:hypothetical protein